MSHNKTKLLATLIISLILFNSGSSLAIIQLTTFEIQAIPNNYSVILMIGDGMGFNHVKLGRYVEVGKENNLTMELLPKRYSVYTNNINDLTTDSAAAATALATGVKTNNGKIAVSIAGEILESILETAIELGKSTGIITTTYIQHATPACFMAHVSNRGNYEEITNQIVENANVDVLLGGGLSYMSEQQIETMETKGYTYVTNKTTLEGQISGRILGLFSDGNMPFEKDRNYTITPSLAEMTGKSIEILAQDTDGFFLMVEGGRIDSAAHSNDKVGVALETIAFDKAMQVALKYTKEHSNTILLVTADHETGGLAIVSDELDGTVPKFGDTEEQNQTLRISRVNDITVTWKTGGHTSTPVPLFATGNALARLRTNYLIDNTEIHQVMYDYFLGNELTLPILSEPISLNQLWLFLTILVISLITITNLTRRKQRQKRRKD